MGRTYHAADGNATAGVDGLERRLEVAAADVLKVNVDALGRQPGQRVRGVLLLVVEAGVEAELLGDEVELLVGADGADDGEALALGDLADDLADGAGGGAHEDGLAGLGFPDLVQAGPGREPGHAEGPEEQAQVEAVRVADLADAGGGRVRHHGVLGDGREGEDDVALGEALGAAPEHLGDDAVEHRPVQVKGRRVRLLLGRAHAPAEVGVHRGLLDLEHEAALGGRVDVRGAVLDGQVLAGDGEALGDLFEDERLVLDHDGLFLVSYLSFLVQF